MKIETRLHSNDISKICFQQRNLSLEWIEFLKGNTFFSGLSCCPKNYMFCCSTLPYMEYWFTLKLKNSHSSSLSQIFLQWYQDFTCFTVLYALKTVCTSCWQSRLKLLKLNCIILLTKYLTLVNLSLKDLNVESRTKIM